MNQICSTEKNSLKASGAYWIWRQFDKPMIFPRKELAMHLFSDYLWVTGGFTTIESKGVKVVQMTRSTELYR